MGAVGGDDPADPLYKLSYDPIKLKLLFHEKTTLRNVLDDVVAKTQELLQAYFAANAPDQPAAARSSVEVCVGACVYVRVVGCGIQCYHT